MKTLIAVTAASAAVLASLAAAAPAAAQETEVRVRRAAARMVVIVENRSDIAVEIEPGSGGLPTPTVTRANGEVRIDGELGRRAIRNCRSGPEGARQPGEGASVEIRDRGRVDLAAAPLIVIRTPPRVEVSTEDSAVFGAVGRAPPRSISPAADAVTGPLPMSTAIWTWRSEGRGIFAPEPRGGWRPRSADRAGSRPAGPETSTPPSAARAR